MKKIKITQFVALLTTATVLTCFGSNPPITNMGCKVLDNGPNGLGTLGGPGCRSILDASGHLVSCGGYITLTILSGNCSVCQTVEGGTATCTGTATVTQSVQTGSCVKSPDGNSCIPPASLGNPAITTIKCPCQS